VDVDRGVPSGGRGNGRGRCRRVSTFSSLESVGVGGGPSVSRRVDSATPIVM